MTTRTYEPSKNTTTPCGSICVVSRELLELRKDVKDIKEILETWRSIKGFAAVVTWISTSAKVLTPVIAFLMGAILIAKRFL